MSEIDDDFYYRVAYGNTHTMAEIELLKNLPRIKKGLEDKDLNISINWTENVSEIDFSKLKSDLGSINIDDFMIGHIDVQTLIGRIWLAESLYPDNDLFDERTGRQPEDIIRLLKFIEAKNEVYPIILNLYADGSISVVDGHHRLALISFLKLRNIPILIAKNQIAFL